MNDVIVVEAAQHMQDGVCLSDIGEELVSQSFSFASAFHQSGDVYDFDRSWDDTLRMFNFCQFVQAFVRYGDNTYVRLDRTERKVGRLCFRVR